MQGWLSPDGITDPQLARMTDLSRFSASLSTRENMATARKALEAQPADLIRPQLMVTELESETAAQR